MQTQAGFLISQVKQIGGRVFEKILALNQIHEFNGAQGKILYVLWQRDHIPIIELSELAGLANTTLTSMLDRMEKAGLIRRLPDPHDRRKSLIALTDGAQALYARYEQVSHQMNEIYFKGFDEREIIEFEQYLHRILHNLKSIREEDAK